LAAGNRAGANGGGGSEVRDLRSASAILDELVPLDDVEKLGPTSAADVFLVAILRELRGLRLDLRAMMEHDHV
jgi:hypothetical protein